MACHVQKLIEIARHVHGVAVFSFMQSIVLSIVDVEMGDLRPPTLSYAVIYKDSRNWSQRSRLVSYVSSHYPAVKADNRPLDFSAVTSLFSAVLLSA